MTSITRKTANDGNTKVEFSVPLKHLNNFWRALDITLINCEDSLILTWSKNFVLTAITTGTAERDNPELNARTGATLRITDKNYLFW